MKYTITNELITFIPHSTYSFKSIEIKLFISILMMQISKIIFMSIYIFFLICKILGQEVHNENTSHYLA